MEEKLRQHIIGEIKRLATANGGRPPGQTVFATETGVKVHEWRGRFWAAWGDAVREAGFEPNQWTQRLDSKDLLRSIARVTLRLGHVPSSSEMMLLRRSGEELPSPKTLGHHFSRSELIRNLADLAQEEANFADLARILPEQQSHTDPERRVKEGWVYLIASGSHHKIGRSETIERRMKEIRIAQPEASELVHAIRTDDPTGIEGYWHRRFADRRANGEWFKLTRADVAAFKRRKFQ